jgi:hypothetical protein
VGNSSVLLAQQPCFMALREELDGGGGTGPATMTGFDGSNGFSRMSISMLIVKRGVSGTGLEAG